jgi:hypothetical protein
MFRGILIILVSALCAPAFAGQSMDLEFQLYFKAFCKNDAKEVQVAEINEPVLYRLEMDDYGITTSKAQVFHPLVSAGYQIYVGLEIQREAGSRNFRIFLTPWRRTGSNRDISYGTAFVEQATPTPLTSLGVAVNEEINEATGSYCTLTATIASK